MSLQITPEGTESSRPDRAPTPPVAWWKTLFLFLLLVAATIAAYQPVWHAGFIWNDDVYVTANRLLTAPDGWQRIWLSSDSPAQYFPLTYSTFRLEHALWGLNPAGYHLVNLGLHVVNALLLWRLLSLLRVPGAWLAGALFALHPVQVESVAWVAERTNVLMGFFFLLALLAWRKFVAGSKRGDWKFYLLALLCFLLALASKTTACTLPAVLLLMLWLKRGSIRPRRFAQVMPFVFLGAAAGFLAIWWEKYHQGAAGPLFSLGVQERCLVAARAFWFYLEKLAWPVDLAFSYPRWTVVTGQWTDYMWIGAFVLLLLALLGIRRWTGRGPEVATLFFVATLSPLLGFVMLSAFRYTFAADHYQYLASIGPLALGAAALTAGIDRLGRVRNFLLPVVGAVLVALLGLCTWRQSANYRNEETLWRATLAVNPVSWLAHNNLGIQLLRAGEIEDAVTHFEEALRLDPNYAEAHYNLGNALFRSGQLTPARTHYERALQLMPGLVAARSNFANLLLQTGETTAAQEQLETAVRLAPRDLLARQALGDFFLHLGQTDEAIAQFRAALEIDSGMSEARRRLVATYFQLGRTEEAMGLVERLVVDNPNKAAAHLEAGLILAGLGREDEAGAHFEKALQIEPRNAQAHYNLGNALFAASRMEEAMIHYRQALEAKPDYAAARLNLGNTLMQSNRAEEAVAEYEKALALQPDYTLAHKNLASALNALGRFDEAMEHLQASWKLEKKARTGEGTSP